MGDIVVNEFITLDGVSQAPGGADEDRDGGFEHGGWHMPFIDEIAGEWIMAGINEAAGFLLGRRTYEIFAAYWPHAPQEEQTIAVPLNTKPKYVASSTLTEPLSWQNSTLLRGELADAIAGLRRQDDGDLHVIGSTKLVRSLLAHDLVDELRLMIDPLVLGPGKRIFPDDRSPHRWQLVEGKTTSTGALLAIYRKGAD